MVVAESIKPELGRYVGLSPEGGQSVKVDHDLLQRIIQIKLAAQGYEVPTNETDAQILDVAGDLFRSHLSESHLSPIDERIQAFLDDVLSKTGENFKLPSKTLAVDRYGLARELSFPEGQNEYHNSEIDSYRLSKNGVLVSTILDSLSSSFTSLLQTKFFY